jgi:hypothetical protein
MNIPGPTTQVGTGTDYSVGPLGLLDLGCTAPDGVKCKAYLGLVLG